MTKPIKKNTRKEKTIYAIYKRGKHMGNEKGYTELDAIKSYLSAADYKNYSNKIEFLNQYSTKIARPGVHYYLKH